MLVRKLGDLLPKTVVPVTLSPGFCLSGLRRNATGEIADQFKKMEETNAYTSEEGSRHIIFSAIGGKDEELRGAFISESSIPIELPDWMLSEEGKKAEDKIWVSMVPAYFFKAVEADIGDQSRLRCSPFLASLITESLE